MIEAVQKRVEILHEALPYIQRFSGKSIVIKYGGHAMVDERLKESFARDIVLLKSVGINPIVVHGGGPQIGDLLARLNIPTQFSQGVRITDQATMDVVEMVLVGNVNKEIVNLIQNAGGKCVGLSGKDGGLIEARRLQDKEQAAGKQPSELIDLGKVGYVHAINPHIIETLEAAGFIVVIAPVGRSDRGETLNINADLVAGSVAQAVKAEKLILLTDVPGIRIGERWVQSAGYKNITKWVESGHITGGMLPKLDCVHQAMQAGVHDVHVLDGRIANVLLLELFTDQGVGTMFRHEGETTFRP